MDFNCFSLKLLQSPLWCRLNSLDLGGDRGYEIDYSKRKATRRCDDSSLVEYQHAHRSAAILRDRYQAETEGTTRSRSALNKRRLSASPTLGFEVNLWTLYLGFFL